MDGELDGPYESYSFASYYENGQLERKGTYNMGQRCGEWIQDGETQTYPPCHPGIPAGDYPLVPPQLSSSVLLVRSG